MAPLLVRKRRALAPHFPVGGPVAPEDLVGREPYIRRTASRLEDGEHLLVAGPRRIGKTSVMLEVLRRLRRKGAVTAYVDCLGATDLRGLGERLAASLLTSLEGHEGGLEDARAIAAGMRPHGRIRVEHLELVMPIVREPSAQRAFDAALDLPRSIAARAGRRVVVAFDEFQAAGRLGPRVFDVMRARFQAQRGVAYAFLGSEEGIIHELFSAKGKALYRFAVAHDLAEAGGHRFGIDPSDWQTYLRRKFAQKRMTIGEAEVDRVVDLTGGHPQDTMQLCAALYHFMQDQALRAVTAQLVDAAFEIALRELERPFTLHWSDLGEKKYLQAVAKRIARGEPLYAARPDGDVPRAEVLRAVTALRARGLVVRTGRGRYEYLEPMLAEHVRRLDAVPAIVLGR
ncbi:MAG: AAA family ATPase [Chloroflexota bacterium]|nr:AAA family ATPase [Chloroflexota bacterium]MDE3101824.1 AAA family ATPase [Chloroflexota bacterium]